MKVVQVIQKFFYLDSRVKFSVKTINFSIIFSKYFILCLFPYFESYMGITALLLVT